MHCISNPELIHFLRRESVVQGAAYDLDLSSVFCAILERANDFLPSEAGSIFLDDPVAETEPGDPRDLVLIACFGRVADRLVGLRLRGATGIVGEVYRTGRAYRSTDPDRDPLFLGGPGAQMGLPTHSVVCAPLVIDDRTIGVIELLNHVRSEGYSESDLQLLGIFAQTISASILNAIDAQRSKEMSKRDDLTGLYNDRYLHHSMSALIGQSVHNGDDCGLIFLDLDNFKSVNDDHGHLVGSRVLREVGITLRQVLPGPAIPARYGGDEFVIVVPGAGRQEIVWVAETVRQNIESKVFLEVADPDDPVNYPALGIRGVITCSIGVACLRQDVLPTLGPRVDALTAKNELLRVADRCMYEAKESGRNRTVTAWELDTGREHADAE